MEDQLEDIRKCWSEEEGVVIQVNCYLYITQFANYHVQIFLTLAGAYSLFSRHTLCRAEEKGVLRQD